jgi:hypothetical protein
MKNAETRDDDQTPGRTVYLAELQCFLCGSQVGSIETDRKPLPPYGIYHPVNGAKPQRVADWRSLRCNRCGGALYTENVEAVIRHTEPEDRPSGWSKSVVACGTRPKLGSKRSSVRRVRESRPN